MISVLTTTQLLLGNLPTTGSLTAVKLARQCFDNETADMINYPISASTTPNPNPNPNSNSNPNSRGQRGHNRCVIGVIKCKVAQPRYKTLYCLY